MKYFILAFLAISAMAHEYHYHYHFSNLDQGVQRELRNIVMEGENQHLGAKYIGCKTLCFIKNMFNSSKKAACYNECKLKYDTPKPAVATNTTATNKHLKQKKASEVPAEQH